MDIKLMKSEDAQRELIKQIESIVDLRQKIRDIYKGSAELCIVYTDTLSQRERKEFLSDNIRDTCIKLCINDLEKEILDLTKNLESLDMSFLFDSLDTYEKTKNHETN